MIYQPAWPLQGIDRQTKTFETRAEAEQWARAIDVEMAKGAFVSRAEAKSTTLRELLERYLEDVTPLKKGAEPETDRLNLMMRHPLAHRCVAGIRGVDIARWRDERRGHPGNRNNGPGPARPRLEGGAQGKWHLCPQPGA